LCGHINNTVHVFPWAHKPKRLTTNICNSK